MMTRTNKYKIGFIICAVVSWLLVLGPLTYYTIVGFLSAEVEEKATLGLTLVASAFLTAISFVFKKHIRSTIFIIILGIYVCLDNILPLIILICVCTMLDEFIVTPLERMFINKFKINYEIDKRMP